MPQRLDSAMVTLVLNYFVNRQTIASAESLNAKIKHFRTQLHGVVDVRFSLYRLSLIHA